MRHNCSLSAFLVRSALLAWVLLASALTSCMDSVSVQCAHGEFYCPVTQRCSADGMACIALSDSCGDGQIQPGEACDDGNRRDGDGCNHSCTSSETCGNGIQDPTEACDDGNTTSGDGCSADCKSAELCGNEYIDVAKSEKCDDGNNNSGDGCSADCKSTEFCGNSYTDTSKGEVCDDGNNTSGDGCSGDCHSNETCGNGYVDSARGEVCDNGNTTSGDGCSDDCLSNETCGNNYKDPWEACDDGNNDGNDQCSGDCKVEGQGCGNNHLDPGELCDDGNQNDDDNCLHTCTPAKCGDGILSPRASYQEDCDLGQSDTATCTRFCRFSSCGDRYINLAAAEVCEDGNSDKCGTCSSTCKAVQIPAKATGFIDAVPENNLDNGETFTLNDGIHNPPVIFEFSDGSSTLGRVKIQRQGTDHQIALAIIDAINNRSNFDILASLDPDPQKDNHVLLEHRYKTALGNRSITETVQNSGFRVGGMTGGGAGDCTEGMGCTVYEDCAPWFQCRNGACRP